LSAARFVPALVLAAAVTGASDTPPTAIEVMSRVNDRAKGGDADMHLRLVFRDLQRGEHVREVDVRRKQLATGYRSRYRLTAPDHLVGISLLIAEDREMGGMWMYLPNADHLVPVVTRGLSALASDFTCEDLRLSVPLGDYDFAMLGADTIQGKTAYKIEMRPRTERMRSELGFAKSIGWVLPASWMIVRAEYLDAQGAVFKTFQGSLPESVQGTWTIRHYVMTNHRARHETEADVVSVRYGLQWPKAAFEPEALKAPMPMMTR
jgi:hypothetical protein